MSAEVPEDGRLVPPYGGTTHCRNASCEEPLGEEHGAYLHKDRASGKFLVLCGPCSRLAQMNAALAFPLVPL
jgi:hypothetical protein